MYSVIPAGKMLSVSNVPQLHPGIANVYVMGYRFKDKKDETWTLRFNKFKYGDGAEREKAIKGAAKIFPEALKTIGIPSSKTLLVSAISSDEIMLRRGSALYAVGEKTASVMGWGWAPTILSKKKHERLHVPGQTLEQRNACVKNAYTCGPLLGYARVVILDDFFTAGSTMTDIARAISVVSSSVSMLGVALGKTEKWAYAKEQGIDLDNSHIPGSFQRLWDSYD